MDDANAHSRYRESYRSDSLDPKQARPNRAIRKILSTKYLRPAAGLAATIFRDWLGQFPDLAAEFGRNRYGRA